MTSIEEIIAHPIVYLFSLDTLVIAISIFIIAMILATVLERAVMRRITLKRKKTNLGVFLHAIKYGMVVTLIIFLIRTYSNPNTDYSVIIGLMSASLGFALQKPITGVAAWLIIILKKPFYIGDRIIVGKVKGDVIDISLSHIVLQEVGGTVSHEDRSGRIIHLPTLILFEENIINYTLIDEYILDEITVLITYESNLEKAEYIIQKSANQVLKAFNEFSKEPYVRLFFDDSGINIKVRYFVPAPKRQEISSDIIRLIHDGFNEEDDVVIAYPHVELVFEDSSQKALSAKKKKKMKVVQKKVKASKKK